METQHIQAGTDAILSSHGRVVGRGDYQRERKTRNNGQATAEASGSKEQKSTRKTHDSPYVAGMTGSAQTARSQLRRSGPEEQTVADQRAKAQGNPLFPPKAQRHFYNKDVGAWGQMLGPRPQQSLPSGSRAPSPFDSYGELFPNNPEPPASSSNYRPRAQNPLANAPMLNPPAKGKGRAIYSGVDTHSKSGESSLSDRSGSPDPLGRSHTEYVEVVSSDSDPEVVPKPAQQRSKKRPPAENLGSNPKAKPYGLTRGEELAAAGGRGPSTSAASGKKGKPDDEKKRAEKTAAPKGNTSKHFPSSNLQTSSAPYLTADVEYAYIESLKRIVEICAPTMTLDVENGACSFTIPGKKKMHLPIGDMRLEFKSCDKVTKPYLLMSIHGDSCHPHVLGILKSFTELRRQDTFCFVFHFKPAPPSVELVKAAVAAARSQRIKVDVMTAFEVRAEMDTLGVYEDGKLRPELLDRFQTGQNGRGRVGDSAAQPYHALSKLSDNNRPVKEQSKKRKSTAEAPVDPKQQRLDMTSGMEKPTKTVKVPRKSVRETVDMTSPEPKPTKTPILATRASKRLLGKESTSYEDNGSDGEIQATKPVVKTPTYPRPENWHGVLFPYPLQGRADINITEGDRWRVESGDFLNDTLIEFGLKHVLYMIQEIGNGSIDIQKDVHLFNSFFYEKLSSGTKPTGGVEEKWPAYESVKKWTKGKDIFDKKLLIIPINENAHWYFAIIYNPRGIMRPIVVAPAVEPIPLDIEVDVKPDIKIKSDDVDTAAIEKSLALDFTRSSTPRQTLDTVGSDIIDATGQVEPSSGMATPRHDSDVNLRTESSSNAKAGQTSTPPANDADADDGSAANPLSPDDPLDVISRKPPRRLNMQKLRLAHTASESLPLSEPAELPEEIQKELREAEETAPQPLKSLTLTAYDSQNQPFSPVLEAAKEDAKAGSKQEETEDTKASDSVPVKTKKGKSPARILDSEEAWVMTFDSLGGGHPIVDSNLQKWLIYEANDKLSNDYTLVPGKYREARIPQQPNFSDCGLYLIHYVWQILQNYREAIKFIELPYVSGATHARTAYVRTMNQVFGHGEVGQLREIWTAKIDGLKKDFDKLREKENPTLVEPAKDGVNDQDGEDDIQITSQPNVAQDLIPAMPEEKTVDSLLESPVLQAQGDIIMGEQEDGLTDGVNHLDIGYQPYQEDIEMEDVGQDESPKLDKGKGKAVDPPSPSPIDKPPIFTRPGWVTGIQNRTTNPPPLVNYESSTTPKESSPTPPFDLVSKPAEAGIHNHPSVGINSGNMDPTLFSGIDPILRSSSKSSIGTGIHPQLATVTSPSIYKAAIGDSSGVEGPPASQKRNRELSDTPPPHAISPPNMLFSSGGVAAPVKSHLPTPPHRRHEQSPVSVLSPGPGDLSDIHLAAPHELDMMMTSGEVEPHVEELRAKTESEPEVEEPVEDSVEDPYMIMSSDGRDEMRDKTGRDEGEQDDIQEEDDYVELKKVNLSIDLDREQAREVEEEEENETEESLPSSAQENIPPRDVYDRFESQSDDRRGVKTVGGGLTAGRKGNFNSLKLEPLPNHHRSLPKVLPLLHKNTSPIFPQPDQHPTLLSGLPTHQHAQNSENRLGPLVPACSSGEPPRVPTPTHIRFPSEGVIFPVDGSSTSSHAHDGLAPPSQNHLKDQNSQSLDRRRTDSRELPNDDDGVGDSPLSVMSDGVSEQGAPPSPEPTPQNHSSRRKREAPSPEVVIETSTDDSHPKADSRRSRSKPVIHNDTTFNKPVKSGPNPDSIDVSDEDIQPSSPPPSSSRPLKLSKPVGISNPPEFSRPLNARLASPGSPSSEIISTTAPLMEKFGALMGEDVKKRHSAVSKIDGPRLSEQNPARGKAILAVELSSATTGKKRSHSGNGGNAGDHGSSGDAGEISGGQAKKIRVADKGEGKKKPRMKRQSHLAKEDEGEYEPDPAVKQVTRKNKLPPSDSMSPALYSRVASASPVPSPKTRSGGKPSKTEKPIVEDGKGNTREAAIDVSEL